jgi:hypothetical protein
MAFCMIGCRKYIKVQDVLVRLLAHLAFSNCSNNKAASQEKPAQILEVLLSEQHRG